MLLLMMGAASLLADMNWLLPAFAACAVAAHTRRLSQTELIPRTCYACASTCGNWGSGVVFGAVVTVCPVSVGCWVVAMLGRLFVLCLKVPVCV